jgi:membrane protease YdiL (CAAX protease family)
MEPEVTPRDTPTTPAPLAEEVPVPTFLTADTPHRRDLSWFFVGSEGLRAGWSVLIFFLLTGLFMGAGIAGILAVNKQLLDTKAGGPSPVGAVVIELMEVLAILGAGLLVSFIERRRLLDYNLAGSRRLIQFASGLVAGFAALSALVGAMTWGGWLHFGPVALTGGQIYSYAALWGTAFVLTGLFEEGTFRCYLQSTLTRGLNFWWALGIIALLCGSLLMRSRGNGVWGVLGFALLGLPPCFVLYLQKVQSNGFWQAAWVTSTLFGYIHTGNNGENWVGIFAAAAVGFIFCVSVRLTGSAWWAIGCHAAWDWAETYFYGTADSGFVASGHLLTTTPTGNALWSGGTDGPEGSLLILPILLLLLGALLLIYGRGRRGAEFAAADLAAE